MNKAIIIDIDNTLLDSSIPYELHRKQILTGQEDYTYLNAFYSNLDLCTKNEWCYTLIDKMTKDNDIIVLFITGRDERVKRQTEKYLKFSHKINYELYMRQKGDIRDNDQVKREVLDTLLEKYEILFAIDDEEPNCDLFKSYGIPTLKVW